MKNLMTAFALLALSVVNAQNMEGAWRLTTQNGKPMTQMEYIKIYQDGYMAFGARETATNKFVSAGGGPFILQGNTYQEVLDFYTVRPEMIGQKTSYTISFAANTLIISASMHHQVLTEVWEKIGDQQNDLTGHWVFTGRMKDSTLTRSTPGARRTIKILSGGRFQWVAFNSDTKEFFGTGGGTYTAANGNYTENISFFSRDDKRVGASLSFGYQMKDGEWHHSGISSAGAPIYEIWSKYGLAYKPAK